MYNTKNEYTETGFAHLSDFVQNFSDPIKRLSDEFSRNHLRTLEEAIKSLLTPYQRKSAYVDPQASFQSTSLIGHEIPVSHWMVLKALFSGKIPIFFHCYPNTKILTKYI